MLKITQPICLSLDSFSHKKQPTHNAHLHIQQENKQIHVKHEKHNKKMN